MKLARMSFGSRTALVKLGGTRATVLLDDTDRPAWSDPLRRWLSEVIDPPEAESFDVSDGKFLAPVVAPQKVIAVGFNYRAHGAELSAISPGAPLLFTKSPGAIIGPGDTIFAPPHLSAEVDYEGELAVVIGRQAKNVEVGEALEYVAGYTICNDVSARDAQRNDGQFFRGKSFDTFCPLGPWISGADEIPDPQALYIRTTVNGELRQNSPTSLMIFSVAEIIAYASRHMTLEPGDVITTGSPAGVGAGMTPPTFLKQGDEVVVEIEGIGALKNTVSTGENR